MRTGGGNRPLAEGEADMASIRGNGRDNTLDGTAGSDYVLGGGGNDVLLGREGDDLLNGGADDDVLEGGAGNDDLNGAVGADSVDGGVGSVIQVADIDPGIGGSFLAWHRAVDAGAGSGTATSGPSRPGACDREKTPLLTPTLARALLSVGCIVIALGGVPRPAHAGLDDFINKLGDKVEELGDGVADKVLKRTEDAIDSTINPNDETTKTPPATNRSQHGQPAGAQPSPAGEPVLNRDRVIVGDVQRMLNEMGYDAGPVDGAYGGRTARALSVFQRDHGLPPSGDITAATLIAVSDAWRASEQGIQTAQPQQPRQPAPFGGDQVAARGSGAAESGGLSAPQHGSSLPTAPAPSGGLTSPAPGGGLAVPALGGALIASSPAAPMPAQRVAESGAPHPSGAGPEGLVICSTEEIVPLSPRTVGRMAATMSVATQLDTLLRDHGVNSFIRYDPAMLGGLYQTLRSGLAPVAFYDRRVSVQPDGLQYGEMGAALRLGEVASYCKLVLEIPVCERELGPEEMAALKCEGTRSADVPAPGSGLVASAPGLPAPAPAALVPAQAPIAGGLDPLAPGGVSIGMKGSDAVAALEANGYQAHGDAFAAQQGKASRRVEFFTRPGQRRSSPSEPVRFIRYDQKDPDFVLSGVDVVNRMSARIGAQPACQIVRDVLAVCFWLSPPRLPLVRQIDVTYDRTTSDSKLVISLSAADDLEVPVASLSEKATAATAGNDRASDGDPLAPGGASSPAPAPSVATSTAAPAPPGGLVAPAPAGGLVAPAPGGGQISPGGSNAGAQTPAGVLPAASSRPPFDPLAPGGVSIGMKGPDAVVALEANGYERGGSCDFRAGGDRGIKIELAMGDDYTCKGGQPVTYIYYFQSQNEIKESPRDIVHSMNERLGAAADCDILDDKIALCEWGQTPGAPLVKGIQLLWSGPGQRVQIYVTAVDDVESRLRSPSPGAAAAKAESERPGDLDPLAPGGVTIGMEMSAAEAVLTASGYRRTPRECDFITDARQSRMISLDPESNGCPPGEAVRTIHYQQSEMHIEGSLADFVDRMNKKLGADAKCATLNERQINCHWESPPAAPLVNLVALSASKTHMDFSLQAVNDLESRVALSPPPAPSLEEQPWWVQEIARSEAEAEGAAGKFVRSERFEQLPSAMQARLGAEGRYVYDYCKGRQTFAQFHDCRCVASKLVEVRIDEGGQPLDQNEQESRTKLIGKADGVADACPNKAGAASYAYQSCTANFDPGLAVGLKEYCTCYVDIFAAAYTNNPESYMPHVRKLGVFAHQECERQGYRRPSDR